MKESRQTKIKCLECGSTDVILEAKCIVRFKINDTGDVEIISKWSDIIEQIQGKVAFNCECQECDTVFGKWTIQTRKEKIFKD